MRNPFYINQRRIQAFVDRIERQKKYKRDSRLIFRHLIEEIGELSAALYQFESNPKTNLKANARGGGSLSQRLARLRRRRVGREICDVISLSVYLATVCSIDLNEAIERTMEEVNFQYGVKTQ